MASNYYEDLERAGDYLEYGEGMRARRAVWENEWKEITPYTNPRRSFFNNDYPTDMDGRPVAEDVYDSTAIHDATTMRDGMVGYNVGPRIRWAALTLTDPNITDMPYVKDWLEECEKRLYMIWSNSNFYGSAGEMVMDAVTIGTATMLAEDPIEYMKMNFQCRHPHETFIDEIDGKIDLWYRRLWLTGRSMCWRYGNGDADVARARLGDELYDKCKDQPQEKAFLIHHFIHPRKESIFGGGPAIPSNRPWASVEISDDTGKDSEFLADEGFYESPLMTWRWEKNSDEVYGRSPAMKAKSEILRLNEVGRTMTESVQLFVERPLNVPEELAGKERLIPWGKNYYKRDNRKIEPMDLGGAYPIGIDWTERMEQRIHDHFHADLFKMLTHAERQMTAREINERMGEKVALLSAPLTGQNSEMLAPVVKRTFHTAMRNGWLPLPPPSVLRMNVDIDVEFVGPLAQAQQRYHQSHNITAGLGTLQQMGQASGHMELWDNVNLDELSRTIMENEGFPQKAITEVIDRDKVRAKRAEEQEKAKKMADAERMAGMSSDTNQAPEQGSIAEALAAQAAGGTPGLN